MTSAREAIEWMKGKAHGRGDRVLFRGQNRVWPTITPSITRLDEQTMKDMWAICRWFGTAAHGVTGYCIPNEHDRLAILQHYLVRSPVIDLTATPEIALYFALQGAETGASASSIRSTATWSRTRRSSSPTTPFWRCRRTQGV